MHVQRLWIYISIPNIQVPNYIKQIINRSKRKIYNRIIVGDFNTPLSTMDRVFRQKMKKETLELNDTLEQGLNRYVQNILSHRIYIF